MRSRQTHIGERRDAPVQGSDGRGGGWASNVAKLTGWTVRASGNGLQPLRRAAAVPRGQVQHVVVRDRHADLSSEDAVERRTPSLTREGMVARDGLLSAVDITTEALLYLAIDCNGT